MILSAGPINVNYENGFLRYFRHGDTEVLRMIYFALRDEHWDTFKPHLLNKKEIIGEDHFRIEYDCINKKETTDVFRWHASIEGTADGTVTFEIQGEALQSIKRNRAGFCILHPIKGIAGQAAEIHHPDKSMETKQFPILVSPENPFKEVRKLRWKMKDVWFEVAMSGDVFETEDQRNWTDASYKTFCTPQNIPIPVQLKRGDQVYQKVVFHPVSPLPKVAPTTDVIVKLTPTGKRTKLPAVGVGSSTEVRELSKRLIDQLRALNLDHYRVDVWPGRDNWVAELSHDYGQAFELGLTLEVALHLTSNYKDELEAFTQLCLQNRVRIKKILLLSDGEPSTDQGLIAHALTYRNILPKVLWGAGTDGNFVDLNRNRFQPETLDFVSYSVYPQVHAFDDTTMFENIEGQAHSARTAKDVYPDCELHISPVTLKKRTGSNEQRFDLRLLTSFAALWTFGSLRALSEEGVASATYYQSAGKQGIVAEQREPFPVYELLSRILPFRNKDIMVLDNPHPLLVDAILFDGEKTSMLWMANYTAAPQRVLIADRAFTLSPGEIRSERLNSSEQL